MRRRLGPAPRYAREHALLVAVVVTAAAVAVVGLTPRLQRSTWAAVRSVSAATARATSAYWTAHRLSTATPLNVSANPDAPSQPLAGLAFGGTATVGALFFADGTGLTAHYCSASVVHSRTRNLVVTAAHCVYDASSGGYRYDIAFVPGYHAGEAPFGVWVPTKIVVDSAWTASADPDHDVGFLVVSRTGGTAGSADIEDVTGANTLGIGAGFRNLAEVVGYPGDIDAPVRCWNYTTERSPTQLSWVCGGYPDGTSGGPFLIDVDGRTGTGVIVGVVGGYEQGGLTPDVSYSTYFGPDVEALYRQAVSEA